MVAIKIALISVLTFFGAVNSVPAPDIDYVNALVPGKGLPSPKELGMTNADLMKPIPVGTLEENGISERDNVIHKRYKCRFTDVCKLADSTACFNYLLRLNTKACSATKRPTQFCRMGGCSWIGQAENANQASSYCRDVAHGGKTVNDRCRLGNIVGGYNFAGGNGNLRVTLAGN